MNKFLTFILLTLSVSAFGQTISDTAYSAFTGKLKSSLIPDAVFKKTNLKHLYIKGDDCDLKDDTECWMIYKIPSDIVNLQKLETLSLPQNGIKYFPNEIAQLKDLKVIDMTDNNIVDISILVSLANLEELYLYGCNLRELPNDIGKLSKLKKLGLKGNP